jgi:hypothetical protein
MNVRARLPNRRLAETFELQASGLQFTCTIGRFPDGRLAEIFLTNHKAGSHADTSARRRALCRDADGTARGPLGVALDLIFGQER